MAIILWATEVVVISFGLSSKRNMPMLFGTSYGSFSLCTIPTCLVIGQPIKKVILYYTWKEKKGKLTGNDFSATVPWTTSEILKVVICLIPKKKKNLMKMKNVQWVLIMFMNISEFRCPLTSGWNVMYVNKKVQFNHFKKKTNEPGDFTWDEKSYQHIHGHYFHHNISCWLHSIIQTRAEH